MAHGEYLWTVADRNIYNQMFFIKLMYEDEFRRTMVWISLAPPKKFNKAQIDLGFFRYFGVSFREICSQPQAATEGMASICNGSAFRCTKWRR